MFVNQSSINHRLFRPILSLVWLCCMSIPMNVLAQSTHPENSNYLIEHGISPRILDAAASSLMQDGSFIQDVLLQSDRNGVEIEYKMQVLYDPAFTDGMDIRFVVDSSEVSKEDVKYLKKLVQNSHHFSRMSNPYLYDENTLKIIKNEASEVIFEFYYQKQDVEPYLRHIKKLKGNIVFRNGTLDYVKLTNIKPLKGGIIEYEKVVYYEHISAQGGHVVTKIIETAVIEKSKTNTKITNTASTLAYFNPDGKSVQLSNTKDLHSPITDPDTISVKLGWVLPLLGKPATKLGYKLPRPVGLDLFTHFQDQTMQFTDLSLSMNDDPFVSFADLVELDKSTITATSFVTMAKVDVWILPFLNVMGIIGTGQNDVHGVLPINEDLKQSLIDYGWLIGIDPEDVPESIVLKGSLASEMYGGGFTLAAGVGDWNVSLNYQLMFAKVLEANTTSMAHVFMPMVGYMTKFGMNLMAGVQGQFYDSKISGFLELDDGQRLNYNVEFEPTVWNVMFGIYKGFAQHWEIALQAGVGNRSSVTAVFGYRF